MNRSSMELPVYNPRADVPIHLEEIDFYVTMRCNLTCDFCSVSANEYDHEDLPLDRCLELIHEAHAMGLKELHFSGGEPTLRNDLEDMIKCAADLGIHTRIITNGFRLSNDRLRVFRSAGLDEIMVSLDGFEQTHNRFRGSGQAYERTSQTIADCLDVGFRTRVSAVAYKENVHEMIPLMEAMDRSGVHIFSVFLGSPLGRGKHHRMASVLSANAWRSFCTQAHDAISDLGIKCDVILEQGFQYADGEVVDRGALKGRGTGCATLLESFDYLIVRSDGSLFQCVFFVKEGRPIGNVRHMPIGDALRQALRERVYQPFTVANDKCVSCDEQHSCGGGCPGYAYLYKGDWLKTDPRCSKTDGQTAEYYPLCPILKLNAKSGKHGGSTDQALRT